MSGSRSHAIFDVVIIGGGASGVTTAVQLLRSQSGLRIALIEPQKPGLGIAYRTKSHEHLLNVRASNMSIDPADPDSFIDWIRARKLPYQPSDFIPRLYYGQYLQDSLDQARDRSLSSVQIISTQASKIRPGTYADYSVLCADQDWIEARNIILCLGNLAPQELQIPGVDCAYNEAIISNPWQIGSLNRINKLREVLIIGSGLTALDIVADLQASGFNSKITLLSRRGQVSQSHAPNGNGLPTDWRFDSTPDHSLRSLVRDFLRHVRIKPETWRAQIDALRPHTAKFWGSLSQTEQRRFLRHLRPYWDTHRHRVAEQIGSMVQKLRDTGKLQVVAGRIQSASAEGERLRVTVSDRSRAQESQLLVGTIINCSGPNEDLARHGPAIIRDSLSCGLLRLDALGMGLDVDAYGRVRDCTGEISGGIYAIGPLRKGTLWESSAMPEIRAQALEVVQCIQSKARGRNFFETYQL